MNKEQWIILGVGLMVLSSYLFWTAHGNGYCNAMLLNDAQMTTCIIHRYAYSIPAIISMFLSWMAFICGGFEK